MKYRNYNLRFSYIRNVSNKIEFLGNGSLAPLPNAISRTSEFVASENYLDKIKEIESRANFLKWDDDDVYSKFELSDLITYEEKTSIL